MTLQNFGSLMGVLLVVVVILILAWQTSRWIGTAGNRGWSGMGRPLPGPDGPYEKFHIVAQIAVGRNERFVLLKIGETCALLGVTEHHITLLKELDGAESEFFTESVTAPPDFLTLLRENFDKLRKPNQDP